MPREKLYVVVKTSMESFFAFLAVGREVEKTDLCRWGEYFLS